MALSKYKTHTFYRTLYAGIAEKVSLLKRDDDQRAGTVRAVTLFFAKKGTATKTANAIHGDMSAHHSCTWMLPVQELKQAGVAYINALDRIVDKTGKFWQPEATTNIVLDAFENYVTVDCLRVDPDRS